MADEEVNIRINETRQGNALDETKRRIEELKKQIAELNRLSEFRSKGGDQVGAGFARQDAAKLQKELNGLTREQAAHERAITREHREREAVMKARGSRLLRLGNAAMNFAESQAGMGGFGGVTSAMRGMGARVAVPAMIAVMLGKVVSDIFEKGVALQLMGMDHTARMERDQRHARRMAGPEGSADVQHSEALDAADALKGLEKDQEKLDFKAKARWSAPATWGNFFMPLLGGMSAAEEAATENIHKKVEVQMKKKAADKNAAAQFGITGAEEIRGQKARIEGNYQEAIAIDAAQQAQKRYRAVIAAHGSEEQAQEAAKMTLQQKKIDVWRGLGGLAGVNAGRGNLAALASLARGFSMDGAEKLLAEQTAVLRDIKTAGTTAEILKTHTGPR